MKLQALNNYITLKMRVPDSSKIGDIVLSEPIQKTPRWGDVLSVGAGVPDINGTLVSPDVEVGDLAYVASHGQHEFKALNEELTITSVLDILAVITDMKEYTIQPLGSLIEIEKIDTPEEKIGSIYLPDTVKFPHNIGKVISLGKGWKDINSQNIPFQVEVGDLVVYNPFAEQTLDLSTLGVDKQKFLVMQGEIYAILKETN